MAVAFKAAVSAPRVAGTSSRVGAPRFGRAAAPVARPLQICNAVTSVNDLAPGATIPSFSLVEPLTGKTYTQDDFKGEATVVMIICNHCPFVVMLKENYTELAKEYQAKGVKVVAINSNDPTVKEGRDAPEKMAEDAEKYGYTFPYLYDEDQSVAKSFYAMCTPEFYVFDKDMKLAYHGQYDAARPAKYGDFPPPSGEDLRAALDKVLAGETVAQPWKPSMGCNVKWVPGNEPAYYGVQGS